MLDKLCVWTFHNGCLWMSITVSEAYVRPVWEETRIWKGKDNPSGVRQL